MVHNLQNYCSSRTASALSLPKRKLATYNIVRVSDARLINMRVFCTFYTRIIEYAVRGLVIFF